MASDGYDSSGHAFWVYNPRLSDPASCTLSQIIKKPKEAISAIFSAHFLARSGSASFYCTLTEGTNTTVLADVKDAPATGQWSDLNKTVNFPSADTYKISCKLTCPPDGSLRVDDISLISNEGGECGGGRQLPRVGNYTFAGCHTESPDHRVLSSDSLASNDMIPEKCAAFCKDWPFFSVEFGRECYCGTSVARDSKPAPLRECNKSCAGNSSQICGDGNRLSLYHDPAITGPIDPPKIINGSSGWLGCYTETGRSGGEGRTLSDASYTSANMTLSSCEKFCVKTGLETQQNTPFKYWGVEWGQECYCGDTIAKGATKVDDKECQQVCVGNKNEACGGSLFVSLYQNMAAETTNVTTVY